MYSCTAAERSSVICSNTRSKCGQLVAVNCRSVAACSLFRGTVYGSSIPTRHGFLYTHACREVVLPGTDQLAAVGSHLVLGCLRVRLHGLAMRQANPVSLPGAFRHDGRHTVVLMRAICLHSGGSCVCRGSRARRTADHLSPCISGCVSCRTAWVGEQLALPSAYTAAVRSLAMARRPRSRQRSARTSRTTAARLDSSPIARQRQRTRTDCCS